MRLDTKRTYNHGKGDAGAGWKSITFGKPEGEMSSCLMSGTQTIEGPDLSRDRGKVRVISGGSYKVREVWGVPL